MTKGFKKAPENKVLDGAPLNKKAADDVPFDSLDDIFGESEGDFNQEVIEEKEEKPVVVQYGGHKQGNESTNKKIHQEVDDKEEEAPLQNESPADRFKRIANRRVNQALKYIALTKNLASRQYEYTPEQVEIVLGALRREVDSLEDAFRSQSKKVAQINLL